ncbi:MAG: hypothetical protein HQK51_01405 [Oligoflexia bacterium]|nr:hypothetical protein [Oligoflexia bacterium]
MTVIFWTKDSNEKEYYLKELNELNESESESESESENEKIDYRFVITEDEFQEELNSNKPKAIFIDVSDHNPEIVEFSKLIKPQFPNILLYYLESEEINDDKIREKQSIHKNIDGIIKKPLSIKFLNEICCDLQRI